MKNTSIILIDWLSLWRTAGFARVAIPNLTVSNKNINRSYGESHSKSSECGSVVVCCLYPVPQDQLGLDSSHRLKALHTIPCVSGLEIYQLIFLSPVRSLTDQLTTNRFVNYKNKNSDQISAPRTTPWPGPGLTGKISDGILTQQVKSFLKSRVKFDTKRSYWSDASVGNK